jgi:hypothetical protein
MATWLVPCPSCSRHVNANSSCPFCGTAVEAATAPESHNARLHRAAMIGLGAAVALATACAPVAAYGAPPQDTGIVQDATPQDTGINDSGGPAPAYGAAPVDAGTD